MRELCQYCRWSSFGTFGNRAPSAFLDFAAPAFRPEPLERVPIKWNHLIGKNSLKIKELEHGGTEKGEQLFRDML